MASLVSAPVSVSGAVEVVGSEIVLLVVGHHSITAVNPQVETPVDIAGVGESEEEDSDDAPLSEVSTQSSKGTTTVQMFLFSLEKYRIRATVSKSLQGP